MDEEKTPTRCEIPDSDKWDLSHLFAEVSKWQEDFGWVERTYRRIAQWKGKIGQSAETLAEVLEFEKELDLKIERLYRFASRQLAEDSSNNEHLARIGQLQNLLTKIGEAVSYVVPEIQAIDEPRWAEFLRDAALAPWRIKLHKIRRMRPHVLSEREERLLALGATAMNGYDDAFSQLTNVDMKFGVLRDAQGHERPLTQSTYSSFLLKRDGDIRRRAFHQLYEEFQDHQYTLATSLAYSVKADVFNARARNYPNALQASLFPDDVPIAVYDGLISAVHKGIPVLLRYFELRRRALGLDKLHAYDTYVPLVPEIDTQVSFDEAVEKVIASLAPLGDEYAGPLAEGLRGRWCDRYETKGKRSGALTLDIFKSEYAKLLKTYFGDAVVIDPPLDLECLRIPHFYNAFYVYKYATGISAAVALSERVLAGEAGAAEKYLGFLRSGGSEFPLQTLKRAGVDMSTSAPVESTLRLFERRIGELEALLLR